ncbi:MAG: 16S rRNA (cytosine(1402)-N(4))-methyltransferase [Planctomycetota bacterium]|nr:MAG: 16S rRNA (cytosine(1402)-N(4))-methyltransferase [Planctomycetota bacterium]
MTGGESPLDTGEAWPHQPVLCSEVLDLLDTSAGDVVADVTVGAAGHAAAIADQLGEKGTLIGIDRDTVALDLARKRLASAPARIELVQGSYRELGSVLTRLDIPCVDAVLMDLGFSSMQIDDPGRGFSLRSNGPLDMRFDPTSNTPTAFDLLRRTGEAELERWFREYGEERYARRVARAIVHARASRMLPCSTQELARLVAGAVPSSSRRRSRIHPATRVFQALRIVVNGELDELEVGLNVALEKLRDGGRLAVISFHSLEDRMVKRFMRSRMRPLTKKPIIAKDGEQKLNPRSRSAKLRVAVREGTAASDPVFVQECRP